jgi:YVTN family beta-propeller protein
MPIVHRKATIRIAAVGAAVCALALVAPPATAQPRPVATRDLLFAGNNFGGTVTVIDATTFARIADINVIPDLAKRLADMTPAERIGYELVRSQTIDDQFVDDVAVSPDGHTLYVSRSNLADVVAISLDTREQIWRTRIDGLRSDHIAISPDGGRLIVSALTAKKADVLDTASGRITGSFPTGDYPHENQFSEDGRHIYNASIGTVPVPDWLEGLKGERKLTVVNAQTLQVERTYAFSHGIRPFVITPDERTMYAQLSFLNGFVEYDLASGKILRTVNMPLSDEAKKMAREDYPFDSAHHGLALSGDGTKICDAGTISDYVAILSRPSLTVTKTLSTGDQPYWAYTSRDGKYCYVSNSLSNTVSIISYAQETEVARVPVGNHPQRIRTAAVPVGVL